MIGRDRRQGTGDRASIVVCKKQSAKSLVTTNLANFNILRCVYCGLSLTEVLNIQFYQILSLFEGDFDVHLGFSGPR